MARIELRDATIRIKDGFGGSGLVDDITISGGQTAIEIDTLASLPNATTRVPVGARFTIDTVADTVFVVTAEKANKKFQVVVDATSGNFTLTFNGQTSASIPYNETAVNVQAVLVALSNVASGDVLVTLPVAGTYHVEIKGAYANLSTPTLIAADVDLAGGGDTVTVSTLRAGAVSWELTFTPALDGGDRPVNNDVITFLPQQIDVKVGNGNLTYTETKNYNYELDRGNLDTVREGDEAPLEVSLEFVYEFVRTGTSEQITPVDALKGIGGASGWFSSSADPCEPYCVDIEVFHDPPCGTAENETTTFPEFRRDSLEFDLSAATISCKGKCNVSEAEIDRS